MTYFNETIPENLIFTDGGGNTYRVTDIKWKDNKCTLQAVSSRASNIYNFELDWVVNYINKNPSKIKTIEYEIF